MAERSYHRMSVGEKQAHAREGMREPSVTCPACGTQTTPADLVAHSTKRCPGRPPDPAPHSRWVNWREARALGVPATTLSFWARAGQVRFLGERQDRRYLLRDLALKIAQRRGFRRR